MYKRLHVIANPAAGRDRPVLATLNSVFKDSGIDWDVFVTKGAGDATRLAREAVQAGADLVAAYGGDGTITEAAEGLTGSGVPLAIFPGGTANAIALALRIPMDLAEAATLVAGDLGVVETLDMGQIDGRCFLVAVGIGLAGDLAEGADREAKDRLGPLAYALSTIDALRRSKVARYRIDVDGQALEQEGVTCVIANMGEFGMRALSLAPNIDHADGLLDVVVIPGAGVSAVVNAAAGLAAAAANPEADPFPHWQGREVRVVPEPLQAIQVDGEVLEPAPVQARVLPGAARVVVPRA